jgi:hypothetical protein
MVDATYILMRRRFYIAGVSGWNLENDADYDDAEAGRSGVPSSWTSQ